MFNKELYESEINGVVPSNYSDIVMLVEEKHFSIAQLLQEINNQIEMCENVIRTGVPKTVTVEGEDGMEQVVIDVDEAHNYLFQAMALLIGTIVYAENNDLEDQIPTDIYQSVSDEIKEDFKVRVGLIEEPEEEPEEEIEEEINPVIPDEVGFEGW